MAKGRSHRNPLPALLAALATLSAVACQSPQSVPPPEPVALTPPPPPAEPPKPSLYAAEGKASWYGDFHHGRKTASGEPFDKEAMTAAHRSLPLDTRVRVTNLENGRSVELVVNDRGPYVDGRLIDVSEAAARRLGFRADGVAQVRVEELPPVGRTAARSEQEKPVQVD
jgi:rare lipoprotein A